MTLDFDPVKNLLNQDKHGYALSLANDLEWERALIWADLRKPYTEKRKKRAQVIKMLLHS